MLDLKTIMANYTKALLAKAPTRHVVEATYADTLGGALPHQVKDGVTAASVGLWAPINAPMATTVDVLTENPACYLSPLTAKQVGEMHFPNPEEGELLFGDGVGFAPDMPLSRISLVTNNTELEEAKNSSESFDSVFKYWRRFSHASGYPQPAYPAELEGWVYNEVTDSISCTLNTVSYVGFVSPTRHEDYTFEVELSSVDGDDDVIGIVLGFVVVDGVEYTLSAYRAFNGSDGSTLTVTYNAGNPDVSVLSSKVIGPSEPTYRNAAGGNGWSGKKVLIKATRVGDQITIISTQPDSSVYETGSAVVVDLASTPALAKFRGGVQIGYMCQSQRHSSWNSLQRPGGRLTIVDIRDYSIRTWDGAGWVTQPTASLENVIKPGRFYFNELTGKLFYCIGKRDIVLFGQRGV